MNLFSKNNYKYFIRFLILFIFIILIYGNYNLQINVIENLTYSKETTQTYNTSRCNTKNNINEEILTTIGGPTDIKLNGSSQSTPADIASAAARSTANFSCDLFNKPK
tara:strand:+ start:234 stop:557 length:324 start_codon:yes stop_codon:yes gene_type:complete